MRSKSDNLEQSNKEDLHREMLRLFSELGPLQHAEVARRLTVSKSSVGRYYKRLLHRRIRFIPNVNRWALGLRRVVVRVSFFPEFEGYAREICEALAQLAYLSYFARLMPENEWQLHFQVPVRHQGELWEFLKKLEELEVLRRMEVYQTDVRVGAPFRVEYFDPEEMRFHFDWSVVPAPRSVPDPSELYKQRTHFDATDLRILEIAQTETLQITEIARRAGLDKWKAYWHWKKHIKGRLVTNWYVDWLGTWMMDQSDLTAMSRREFIAINLFAKSLSSGELKTLRQKLNSVPYLWSEMIGKSDMVAQLFIPNESLGNAYAYLGSFDETIKSKIVLRIEDQRNAIWFTVPRKLYDGETGWTFDLEDLVSRFNRLAVQLKENSFG
jgi:DNA-binding Lrp family transcriptional regulator